jgi:type II secretory pathway pseudopilin PulG
MKKYIPEIYLNSMNSIKASHSYKNDSGYMMLILVFAVFVLTIGLMVAVPVWQTQIQREKEEELIFRGKQYVESIRIFQKNNPGALPKSLEDLIEEKCIRKLYKDPMTESGEWNIILLYPGVSSKQGSSPQKVLIASQRNLDLMDHPQIIGVVSQSNEKSIKIYMDQETFNRWLFFYGQDPEKMPEIVYFDQLEQ